MKNLLVRNMYKLLRVGVCYTYSCFLLFLMMHLYAFE